MRFSLVVANPAPALNPDPSELPEKEGGWNDAGASALNPPNPAGACAGNPNVAGGCGLNAPPKDAGTWIWGGANAPELSAGAAPNAGVVPNEEGGTVPNEGGGADPNGGDTDVGAGAEVKGDGAVNVAGVDGTGLKAAGASDALKGGGVNAAGAGPAPKGNDAGAALPKANPVAGAALLNAGGAAAARCAGGNPNGGAVCDPKDPESIMSLLPLPVAGAPNATK